MQQIIDIKNLVKYEENNRIEAKRAKGGLPNSIWETYSAFANTEGGVILLGVDERDDHTLVATGVEDAHKMMTDLWNILNNKQKVSLNILTERMVATHEVEGKTVISIEVPKADRHHRPIHIGSDPMRGTYRRSFEGDYLCTKDEVAAMYRDASDVSIDLKVLHAMDMTVLIWTQYIATETVLHNFTPRIYGTMTMMSCSCGALVPLPCRRWIWLSILLAQDS